MRLLALAFFVGLSCFSQRVRAHEPDSSEEDSSELGVADGEIGTTCRCGWANKESERIVGGVETNVNEFPLMAGIIYTPRKMLFCGGTIITKYHVVTAAHCTESLIDTPEDVAVVLGEHDQDRVERSPARVVHTVKQIIQHEDFYMVGHANDITILVLEKGIAFSELIGPACLPIGTESIVGSKVTTLGWGKLSPNGPSSRVLMKVNLNVVPLNDCVEHYTRIDTINRKQVCTYHPYKDSCQGDSGGPLLWVDPETNRYTLVGATSFGSGCATGIPAVNTNITYYLPWIRKVVTDTQPDAEICTKVK